MHHCDPSVNLFLNQFVLWYFFLTVLINRGMEIVAPWLKLWPTVTSSSHISWVLPGCTQGHTTAMRANIHCAIDHWLYRNQRLPLVIPRPTLHSEALLFCQATFFTNPDFLVSNNDRCLKEDNIFSFVTTARQILSRNRILVKCLLLAVCDSHILLENAYIQLFLKQEGKSLAFGSVSKSE